MMRRRPRHLRPINLLAANDPMPKLTLVVLALVLNTSPVLAAQQITNAQLQDRVRTCVSAGEVAKTVVVDTLKANTFDPNDAVIRYTKANTEVRQILVTVFAKGGLMQDVLIHYAGFGASVTAPGDSARVSIGEFAYWAVRNQCIIDAMAATHR
jgi:hypothetical protein